MTQQSPFNFHKSCSDMLVALGARQGADGILTLDTIAGPLTYTVQNDGLACMFDDVAGALKVITNGALNRISGEWNWMFPNPELEDVIRLRLNLAQVTNMKEHFLNQGYQRALKVLGANRELNTCLTYQYRDSHNCRVSTRIVFLGALSEARELNALMLAFDPSKDHPSMIPGEVGLSDLQDLADPGDGQCDPDQLHPWHEVIELTPVPARGEAQPLDGRTIKDFADEVCRHVVSNGWSEKYLPPFYPEMKHRHAVYLADMAASRPNSQSMF